MSSLRAPAAIAVLSLALTGCAGGSADLEGRTFTATEVRGHDLVEGSAITLAFEDGQVSANAGCNTIFGEAQWDGGTLEAEQLASTLMACDNALMAQDEWLTALLTSSPTLSVDGTTLTIGDATGLTLTEEE
ncbi:MAG: META domain-containing protein [Actinobacteria bacterium]|nr:META domain-containing protein [Actinomycetota bacterium]